MPVIEIKRNKNAVKYRKRRGRGSGSGRGGQSGRGAKGQKARSGGTISARFEGGQMPLYRRIPKRGFRNMNRKIYNIVNISSLDVFAEGSEIGISELKEKGLIKNNNLPVKLLANGELKVKNLKIAVHAFSKSGRERIEKLGGTIVKIEKSRQFKEDKAAERIKNE
jgi:large subunit ribosomal protein L15